MMAVQLLEATSQHILSHHHHHNNNNYNLVISST